nr:MAG TPA: hypothetical protein [Caudoviricetes sp.]
MSSIWSITLALISLSAGEALYTRAQGAGCCPIRSVHAGDHCCVAVRTLHVKSYRP